MTLPVNNSADLAVTKTVDNPHPNVGDTVNFTITVRNHGLVPATGVVVHDPLPPGLTFVSADPSLQYDSTTGDWTVGDLGVGQLATLQLQARVEEPLPGHPAFVNVATGRADQVDPDLSNNTGIATVTPQQADLRLTKRVNDPTPNVGDIVTFTLTLHNDGPNAATGATVADALPAGLTYMSSSTLHGTFNPNTRVWTVGTLLNGATATLTIHARVESPVGATNTGTADATQFDPNPDNNRATADVTPQRADLAVTKRVDNATPNVGDEVTYTITLTNLGPDAATNIRLLDDLPAGETIISTTPMPGNFNLATRVWTVPHLAASSQATLVIRVRVTEPLTTLNTITIIGADQFDPNESNNTAREEVTPLTADLDLEKTVNDATPNVGDTVTFTLRLTNNGPDDATGVVVGDALPPGLTFQGDVPAPGTTFDPATGVWTVGNLANQAVATLTITARVEPPPAVRTNVGVASATQFDPDLTNNRSTATVTPQQADLGLTKTVDNPTPNLNGVVTFTITLHNHGPDDATNVTVHDLLPPGLVFVDATEEPGSTYDPLSGTWTIPTVPFGADAVLTIRAQVTVAAPRINEVEIEGADQYDPNSTNNQDHAEVSATHSDLAVTKRASVSQAPVGSLVTFTVTVHNLGPDVAYGVFVTDALPAGLTFVSAQASEGTYRAATRQWDVGTLGPGGSAVLRITARVTAPILFRNTATVDFEGTDLDPSNNTATAQVLGLPSALSKRNLLGSAV